LKGERLENNNSSKFSRRLFLQGGIATGMTSLVPAPFEKLLNLMSGSFIREAKAGALGGVGSRNYVNLLLAGAPHRYGFDHWIRTNQSDPAMMANPMIATALVNSNGSAVGTQYQTFDYRGLLVPQMFSHSVYNGKGALRPLTNLLDNMMVIRGYGTGMDGHPFNATKQMAPLGGASSIAGLAADYSVKTFEAIQWPNRGAFGNYNSTHGKAMNKLSGSKPLNDLLQGFGPTAQGNAKASALIQRQGQLIDLGRSRLQTYIKSGLPGSSMLAQNMNNATNLIKKGINNIDGYWQEALPRYQTLILNSMRATGLSGLSDMSLVPDQSVHWNIHVADGNRALKPEGDLRNYLGTRTLPANMAEGFALTEYVLKEGLVTSVELELGSLGQITLKENGAELKQGIINDMHGTGSISGVLLTTSFYRGIAAAILELADQLKATKINGTDLWSETVFQITSDFGRSARTDGAGSDHGFNQMVTSVYSGIIKEPLVIGNIKQNGINNNYTGTQGLAAPIDNYNQAGSPTPLMPASTVANLLRVPKKIHFKI
jgi:hypothetical protein